MPSTAAHHSRLHRPVPVRVSAAHALQWLACGWRMFVAQPVQWLLMSLTAFVVMAIISMFIVPFLPILGPMAAPVMFVLLTGGMLRVAERQAAGETLQFRHLLEGMSRHTANLALVGVLFSIPLVLLHLTIMLAMGGGLLVGVLGVALGSALSGVLSWLATLLSTILAGGAIVLVLWLLLILTLIFSPALIMYRGLSPLDAMGVSLHASARNFGPILLFGLCIYALFVLAMAPLGLGVLIFIPVSVGALRQAHHDLFAEATEPA